MGQSEAKQQEQISQNYTLFKTIAPGQYWVRKKKKGDQLLLRILTFYVQDQVSTYLKVLEKRKRIKNSHLLELFEHTRISQHNMCSSMFKIRTIVEHPFRTIRDEMAERTQGQSLRYFSEDEMWSILYSCCHALYSLYINKFHHQALNVDQIFIDTSGIIKIADYVLVPCTKNYLALMNEGKEGFRYISPELVSLVEDNNFYYYEKQKSDVFILAMIILEIGNLMTVKYYNPINKKFNFDVIVPQLEKLRERYSPKFCEIVQQMLTFDFKARPKLQDIINNIEQRTVYTASSGNTSRLSYDIFDTDKDVSAKKVGFSRTLHKDNKVSFNHSVNVAPSQPLPNQINKKVGNIVIPKPEQSNRYKIVSAESHYKPDSQFQSVKVENKKSQIYVPAAPLVQNNLQSVKPSFEKKSYVPINFQLPRIPTFQEYKRQQSQNNSRERTSSVREDDRYKSAVREPKDIRDSNYTPYQSLLGLTDQKNQQRSQQIIHPQSKLNIVYNSESSSSAFQLPQYYMQPSINKVEPIGNEQLMEQANFKKTRKDYMNQQQQQIPERSLQESKHSQSDKLKKRVSLDDESSQQELLFVVENVKEGRYEGYTKNGRQEGIGRLIFPDGGSYEGKWKDGKMQGYGQQFYDNNTLAYEGFWKDSKFNGQGKAYNDNPLPSSSQSKSIKITHEDLNDIDQLWLSYQGEFKDDKRSGKGTMTFVNGERFSGTFVDDRAEGEGTFFKNTGEIIQGIWRENILIEG